MQPRLLCVALVGALVIFAVEAKDSFGCDHCGQVCPCQKTCRLVCETKKVEITCWGCKCEDFCVPGPSKPGCKHCEWICDECAACDPMGVQTQAKKFVWTEWIPGCATIHTRKKLMKKTVTKTVPSYKWVVEELCPHCQDQAQSASVPAGTAIPQPPTAAGATILPVTYVEAAIPSRITDEEVDVQAAASKSSQSFFKLPWQR